VCAGVDGPWWGEGSSWCVRCVREVLVEQERESGVSRVDKQVFDP
jgi:hypothetical protein